MTPYHLPLVKILIEVYMHVHVYMDVFQVMSLSPRVPPIAAYKHADGKKIDGKRIVVDVERGRTVKTWKPRRIGETTPIPSHVTLSSTHHIQLYTVDLLDMYMS